MLERWTSARAASAAFLATIDLGPRRDRLGELGLGQLDAGLGGVVRAGQLLLLAEGHGADLLEVRVPGVVIQGQEQVGLGGLDGGPGLVDPLLDVVLGEDHRGFRLGPGRDRRLQGPPGDLDLDRHLAPEAGEVGPLSVEFPPRGLQPRRGQIDLVAIGSGVDLRHHLALLDPVALIGEDADDPPRDGLGGQVDDVGLDEGVVGEGMRDSALPPAVRECETRPCHQRMTAATDRTTSPIAATTPRTRGGTGRSVEAPPWYPAWRP